MGKKYIQILTHGVIKIDLNHQHDAYQGICSLVPPLPGILLVARSATKYLAIYALLSNNIDKFAAQLLSWLDGAFNIQVVYKLGHNPLLDNNKINAFLIRLKQSCHKLNINIQSCEVKPVAFKIVSVDFKLNTSLLQNSELVQRSPFTNARNAINQFNFLGAYQPTTGYTDYDFDIQFVDNAFTPIPKLTDQGYLLWSMLKEKDYQLLIFRNPNFSDEIKDLICNPFNQSFERTEYLEAYEQYLKLIKLDINSLTKRCLEHFKAKNFTESLVYAEKALEKIRLVHKQHVKEELSIAYYNVGSIHLELRDYKRAHEALKKSASLCVALGNFTRLQKVNAKIAILTDDKLQSLSLLDLPYEIHLRILNNLNVKDFASLIRTSGKSQQIFNQDIFWRDRLAQDFTRSRDLNKTYRKQYKEKYLAIQSMQNELDINNQPEQAFAIGAEVWVEKLFRQGNMINLSVKTLETLLKSDNQQLIKLCLKNGLDVNAPVKDSMGNQLSIFHIAVFTAPEMITLLLKEVTPITILPALHLAVLENNLLKIKALLKDHTTKKTEDISQCSALWWAVATNNYEVAKLLLENDFKLNDIAQSLALTHSIGDVLESLIKNNAYQCFELLLLNGLPPAHFIKIKGLHYSSLLTVAARYGKKEIIELLIKYGAPITMDLDVADLQRVFRSISRWIETDFGYVSLYISPIGLAASYNQVDCLAYLLRISNNCNAVCITAYEELKYFEVYQKIPLSEAIDNLAVESVELLLKVGSNPNKLNMWNWYHRRNNSKDEREESILIQLLNKINDLALLDYSVDFSQPETYPTKLKDWFNILELLIKYQTNFKAFTAGKNFVFELIKENIRINKKLITSSRITFFNQKVDDFQVEGFKLAVLRMLDVHGIDLKFSDDKGKTLLHHAVSCNYFEIVQYLVAVAKVDIHQQDENHETAIFIAARNGKTKLFKYLQQVGGDIDLSNQAHETPRQLIHEGFAKKLSL